MFSNPFTPIFGGKPGFFFGRKRILRAFDLAMTNKGSGDRAMFITGTRGSGKTALLEQLSQRAARRQRQVVDLGPDGAVDGLISALAKYDVVTNTVSPQASLSVMGMGGSLSAGSIARTKHYDRADLQSLLIDSCERSKNGMLVTIDEVQKLSLDDVSIICNAFQMASRKGHDVMLAVAGLPYAYTEVVHHEGCTFLRRGSHEELGLFSWEEAREAFDEAFASISGLHLSEEAAMALNEASYGHPYLMQLLGYHLLAQLNEAFIASPYEVSREDVEAVIPLAVGAYEQRALRPMLEELSDGEVSYLRAMSQALDENRLAKVADVARILGREQRSLSRTRAKLVDQGIIASPSFGRLMYCIPLLASYVLQAGGSDINLQIAQQRGV